MSYRLYNYCNNYCVYYRVNNSDILLSGKVCTEESNVCSLKFEVDGGPYIAIITENSSGTFQLDAVYKETSGERRTKFDLIIPGRLVRNLL